MSTQDDKLKNQIDQEYVENQEEDEQLDEVTSKALKNLKIDDSAFTKDDKNKKADKKSKQNKKSKQKGQDFLEYAKNNGIEVKIQYGEEKEIPKEKTPENTYQNPKPTQNQNNYNKKPYHNKNQYNKKPFYNNPHQEHHYNNPHNINNLQKSFSNKFDATNQQHIPSYYNPFMMQQPMPMNMYQHQQPTVDDDSEKSISECLEYYFSEENLNKDYYIRSRMNDDGYIDAYEIVNFNKMKNRGVNVEKIQEIVSSNKDSIVEYVVSEGRLYLRNREWESFKDKLLPLEVLQMQRKFVKKPQMMNYVNMQNNYFYQMSPMPMQGGFTPSFDMNAGHMFVQPGMMGYPMGMMPPQYMGMGGYMQGDNVNN